MMSPWMRLVLVALGGAMGANARYWLGVALTKWAGDRYPWSTLAINVSGSFLLGVLAQSLLMWHPHSSPKLLLMAGFLGSYTTFSTFTLEGLALWQRGELREAIMYLAGSVAAGFAATMAGMLLADAVFAARGRV